MDFHAAVRDERCVLDFESGRGGIPARCRSSLQNEFGEAALMVASPFIPVDIAGAVAGHALFRGATAQLQGRFLTMRREDTLDAQTQPEAQAQATSSQHLRLGLSNSGRRISRRVVTIS